MVGETTLNPDSVLMQVLCQRGNPAMRESTGRLHWRLGRAAGLRGKKEVNVADFASEGIAILQEQ
jgi:hypothetical protein